MAQKMLKPLF